MPMILLARVDNPIEVRRNDKGRITEFIITPEDKKLSCQSTLQTRSNEQETMRNEYLAAFAQGKKDFYVLGLLINTPLYFAIHGSEEKMDKRISPNDEKTVLQQLNKTYSLNCAHIQSVLGACHIEVDKKTGTLLLNKDSNKDWCFKFAEVAEGPGLKPLYEKIQRVNFSVGVLPLQQKLKDAAENEKLTDVKFQFK